MSESSRRHIVLISGTQPDSKSVAAIKSTMRMTGSVPLLIADHVLRVGGSDNAEIIRKQFESDLAKADGVIVMGNDSDIDPGDYGETNIHPKTHSEKATHEGRVRAAYEYALIKEALKLKLPILAVCGGMQRLNVLLGGTLYQHVPDLVGTAYHHQGGAGIAPFIPVQFVGVVPGTRLADISKEIGGLFTPQHEDLPPGVFMENSFHHQAVDRVANGLIPCAFSIEPDKPDLHIVQAIEPDPEGPYKDQFILGVQWHPEFGASDVSARTLRNFNEQAQHYAKVNNKALNPAEALAASAVTGMTKKWGDLNLPASWEKDMESNAAKLKNTKLGKTR